MSHKPQQSEYDKDFYAWSLHNAALIRDGKLSEVDLEHVAEEIEDMGKTNRRELISRLAVLLAHLLKWKFQPDRRGNSWKYTIKEQRLEVRNVLKESPSLKYELDKQLNDSYELALVSALKETNFNEEIFPEVCPFTLEEALNKDFFPE
jgi:hypothetical protein